MGKRNTDKRILEIAAVGNNNQRVHDVARGGLVTAGDRTTRPPPGIANRQNGDKFR
jgi:hypothetical protein